MFETFIRKLLDDKLTTIKEIEEVTGRGTSTIYRWMNGESEPHFMDMRLLVRQLSKPEARHSLVGMLTSDLPVIINWVEDEEPKEPESPEANDEWRVQGHEVLDRSLLALDCLTHALSEGNEAIRKQKLTKESYVNLVTQVDRTIRHLTASKNMLNKYVPAEPEATG